MKHIALKITAFLFGIALWFYVISLKNFQLEIEAPIILSKLPETLAIASRPPQSMPITVEGRPFDLIRMRAQETKAASIVVDLHDIELGSHRVHIGSKNYSSPNFPNIHYVDSDERLSFIDLDIDTRIVRNVPIKSNVTFRPASGYIITSDPVLNPEGLNVSGARNALMRIIEVPTDSIRYDSVKAPGRYTVPLRFDQLPAYVAPNDSAIEITIDVQKVTNKVFKDVPVHLIGRYDKNEVSLLPSTVEVEITGGEKILDTLKADALDLFVEINRFTIEDVDSLPPTVRLMIDKSINTDLSIKGIQIKPDKVRLQRKIPQPTTETSTDSTQAPAKPTVFTMDDLEEEGK